MPPIKALDKSTIRSIHSGQVITTIDAIVKELLENALDAKATSVDIKLMDDGLLKIEVRDNGCGIGLTDRCNMAKQHYTSKLASFADLESMATYGFRGEALSAMCEVSGEVFITTRTEQDTVAICYKLDRNGGILSETPSGSIPHTGTLVSIYQPFIHLPVRRQVAMKTKANSTKRIQEMAIKYGLSHPFVRLTLHQLANTVGKTKSPPVWIKPSTKSLTDGVRLIYGTTLAAMVEESSREEQSDRQLDDDTPHTPIQLHCLLPSKSSDPSQVFKGERVFIYVDKRPINYVKSELKDLVTMVRKRYKQTLGLEDDGKKLPFMYIDIKTGFGDYDVNIEPDKSVVMLHGKSRILSLMQELLDQTYGSFFSSNRPLSPTQRFSHTIQQVPSSTPLSPDVQLAASHDHPTTSSIDSHQIDELEDESEDLFMTPQPRHTDPPLLTDWLDQQETSHKEPLSADLAKEIHGRQQPRRVSLDWQVDDESHYGEASPPPPTPSTNPLSSWLTQFRRPNASMKRQSNEASSIPTLLTPTKRSRTQIPLSFTSRPLPPSTQTKTFTKSHDPDSSITSDSPPRSPSISALYTPFDTTLPPTADRSSSPPPPSPSSLSIQGRPNRTQQQDLTPDSPIHDATTSTAINKQHIIAPIFNRPLGSASSKGLLYSTNHKDATVNSDLLSSFNDVIPVNSSTLLGDIKQTYTQYRHRHSRLYRKSVADYCKQASSYQASVLQKQPSSTLLEKKLKGGLMLFSKGAYTDLGWLMDTVGAVDIELLRQRYKFDQLMEGYELNSGKDLASPSQIVIRNDSPLYGVIISLEKQDEYIADDHNSDEHSYSSVIDKRITANGFRMRWRKDSYSHDLIVQFTAIADLNGYGPADCVELLETIGHTSLKTMPRPKKVVDYIAKKVKNIADVSCEHTVLDMLASLRQDTQDKPIAVHYLT